VQEDLIAAIGFAFYGLIWMRSVDLSFTIKSGIPVDNQIMIFYSRLCGAHSNEIAIRFRCIAYVPFKDLRV
jgi:hypothetical protein